MIENIKNELQSKLNKKVKVYVKEGRSKTAIYDGVLIELYPKIFLVDVENQKMCFTYSDVLTKKIILK